MNTREYWLNPQKYRDILRLSGPLVLANAGQVFMQLADTIFVGKYSSDAIAALGMAGMTSWLVASFFVGMTGYTSTIVSNNLGAEYHKTAGSVTWQGIYLALAGGAITAILSLFSRPFFALAGHSPRIQAWEVEYLNIMLWGSVFFFVQTALSGFFSGKGETVKLMIAQIAGQILNIVLDYPMVFGRWGFPEMGVAGAAWATVISSTLPLFIMGWWFLGNENRKKYGAGAFGLNSRLMLQILRLGSANGFFVAVDTAVWTLFLLVVGRLGTVELAATTIAFRINTFTFMPVFGLARGMGTLAGQRHGALDHRGALSYMLHGTVLSEAWMMIAALAFVLLPDYFLPFFVSGNAAEASESKIILAMTKVLLRFVAVYSIGDAIGLTLSAGLNSVGDTRWVSRIFGIMTTLLTTLMLACDYFHLGLNIIWTFATAYILLLPLFWIFRLRSGKWKEFRIASQEP